ncbi:MAG: hypothetical protein A3D92_18325 [Bacteroidetes bacterium RIFCSPHIGHO2_02_FULL_44_7]|nr:MAG: hypothetical protein A3D92_18325 [Bacteroidetes bacterium RIFCSPHIGHO2_02_FULL_44_7]
MNLYAYVDYLDKAFHLLGGVVIAWFFSIYLRKDLRPIPRFRQLLFVIACVSLAGVVWEFTEYLSEIYSPRYAPWLLHYFSIGNLRDTLGDLVSDLLGGLVFFVMSKRIN